MNKEEIIAAGNKILERFNYPNFHGCIAQARILFIAFGGKQNEFIKASNKINLDGVLAIDQYKSLIGSFIETVENDLISNFSITRLYKTETVNQYLLQAENLLQKKDLHPAAAVVLIGASLEEFLRNWVSDENIKLPSKPSIDTYALLLKENNLLDKQDHKEIQVWGGLRNDAAHGYWDKVSDRDKIELMLIGVNSFIRKKQSVK